MGNVDPLRVTVDGERQALGLAQELAGVSDVDLHSERDRWVVSLTAGENHIPFVQVLDAVRRSLAGEPTASALVTLDGHQYHMHGASVASSRTWEQDGSTIAHEIRTERSGEHIFVVSLAGEHDLYTAPKVEEALRSVIAAGATTIVVDLTETTFFDSTMLHVLLSARNQLDGAGQLRLVASDPHIKKVFDITGTSRFFDFYSSPRAAQEDERST